MSHHHRVVEASEYRELAGPFRPPYWSRERRKLARDRHSPRTQQVRKPDRASARPCLVPGRYKNRLFAKALPEPDLKYRSKARAIGSLLTAT